jgi:urea carboxylase
VLAELPAAGERPRVVYRQAGDAYLLVEYGPLVLDLELRFRVHALMDWLKAHPQPGIIDLTPGIRSLQLHFDARRTERSALLAAADRRGGRPARHRRHGGARRIVHLPLSWDDPATKLAIEKYMQSVRKDAPWCPSNIEFIRRINGLDSIDEVYRRSSSSASYLVLGLGDVYLGAPVATPMDPRHRLVTTKYNPARTWTPENAVGIGGAYMCVYGMEGPGGYQFVGRTVQMWNRWHHGARGTEQFDTPWLLRFFDQVRFVPVSEAELLQLRKDFAAGRARVRIEEGVFRLADYRRFLADEAAPIAAFKARQQAAFEAERERWKAAGQAEYISEADIAAAAADSELDLPEGARLVAVESMKMEFTVTAPEDGEVLKLLCREATPVAAGQDLLILHTTH